jgi:Ser/Thr protein kinase RdoA (MazF antagonist)
MNQEHLVQLCRDFNLGAAISLDENTEGVLNRNYLLITNQGKYFIKSIREKRRSHLPYIAEVEEFMHSHGIPAVCMLSTVDGPKFVEYGPDIYTVYPFLESVRTHQYDLSDFERMGAMLGRIHRAGSENVPPSLAQKSFNEKPMDVVRAKLEKHREDLRRKSEQDKTDVLFLEYLDLKLKMMDTVADIPWLPKDTLVHGDYHSRNLLINADREIIGICDWEQSDMNARAYELARSLLYVCFNGESEEDPHIYDQDKAIDAARTFIQGYVSIYPISNDEVESGLKLRLRKLICSFWIEEQYYERNDSRSNKFIPHEIRLIRDFSEETLFKSLEH